VSNCIFCRIAAGEIPATQVAETERALAFRDLNPQAPTHVLLIPKQHLAGSAAELRAEHADTLLELFTLAAQVARSEGLGGGWRLVTNVGPDAGQSVMHLHLHLLGGRAMAWPPG
jgi:histidine triad (HIT) family protein